MISNNFPLVIRLGANTIPSPQGKIKKSTTTFICRFVCPSEIFLRALPTPPKGAFAAAQLLSLALHPFPLRLDLGLGTWTWTWTWTWSWTWTLDGRLRSATCALRPSQRQRQRPRQRSTDLDCPLGTARRHWTSLPCTACPHCTALHCTALRIATATCEPPTAYSHQDSGSKKSPALVPPLPLPADTTLSLLLHRSPDSE